MAGACDRARRPRDLLEEAHGMKTLSKSIGITSFAVLGLALGTSFGEDVGNQPRSNADCSIHLLKSRLPGKRLVHHSSS